MAKTKKINLTKTLEAVKDQPHPPGALARVSLTPQTLAVFSAGAETLKKIKFERRNAPRLVKPGEMPIGSILVGEVVRIAPSMKASIKGKLLWLRLFAGDEIMFPLTGVIAKALGGEQEAEKEVGRLVRLVREPDGMSTNYKKPMFIFKVETADLPQGWGNPDNAALVGQA